MTWFELRTWTLRRRVAALVAVAGVFMAVIGVLTVVTTTRSNDHLDTILEKTGPMRVAGQELYSAYLDQETGVRGFALSRSEENLQPYERGREAEEKLLADIERLNADNGRAAIADSVRQVRELSTAWRTTVAEPVIGSGDTGGASDPVQLDEAARTARFNAVRTSVTDLQANILVLRNEAVDAARSTGSTLVVLEITAGVIVVVVGILMLLLLDRLVSRPVTDFAAQVRQVAAGNYDRRITSDGSPELRDLADDVDGMRLKIATELSEVREARAQVEAAKEMLEAQTAELTRSNRDLEQFAYVASHDLQEPLRKVASFCQLLQRRYAGQLDARADQYIAFATDGAQRMQRLINDLLAFSRIGRITTGFTPVDLTEVVTATADGDAHVTWSDLPVVHGEEPLISTVFANLIGNSLKFQRPGVPPEVRISAEQDGDFWKINVRDNGIGIEAQFADKVFVIFQRLHARDAYEGTGIGLAIVKKIVEYHGGHIWLDLDVEQGASVWFTLPVTPAD
ncbi:signal transduction histidine kinase [Actinoplanes lutulentus]|uniref:histidine kinase n=1 Tax=Actinoplanes lutulentus TaxID=1287878 RepID=A0A327Z3F7_9ACTN|nr:ATP-binding protein [Actinoplanes lutulentus]MBB2948892.1 signal transduction histidine kinase [Actinoplanes lutulentus]RAK29802.1 HAMP domain-containing protein [Actinoplanes lutulentus]